MPLPKSLVPYTQQNYAHIFSSIIEALMKEMYHTDNLAIAWQYPGQAVEVVPARFSTMIRPTTWPATCAVDSDCDDGLWCNGTCSSFLELPPFKVNASIICSIDIPYHLNLDDSFYIGDETCSDVGVCQVGTYRTCSDGLLCTDDICNELTDSCKNPVANCSKSNDQCAIDQ
jgi:hypothetical protein